MKNGNRSIFLDIVKGFSIFCVIFGHCIQYGSGNYVLRSELFFDNVIFKVIYSFHMPLFMLVSGYLFAYSVEKRTWAELLRNRVNSLLIPIFTWSVIPLVVKTTEQAASNQMIGFMYILNTYITTTISNLWFLWAVFWCSTAVIFVRQCFNDSKWVYFGGWLLTFIIPDVFGLHLYKFMYPFFIAGYLYNKEGGISKLKTIYENNVVLLLMAVVYAVLLLFYNRDAYIYTTGYSLLCETPLKQLGIDLYRCCIGFIGSAFVLLMIYRFFPVFNGAVKRTIGYLGANTLGIYIISNYLFSYVVARVTSNLPQINYAITVIEAVVVLTVSLSITSGLKKCKLLNQLLFGGRT